MKKNKNDNKNNEEKLNLNDNNESSNNNIDNNEFFDEKSIIENIEKELKDNNEILSDFNKFKDEYFNLKNNLEKKEDEIKYIEKLNLANMANLIKNNNSTISEIKKYSASKLASEIIRPIELFKKVLNSETNNEQVKQYLLGFEMILNQIFSSLENCGIKPMNVKVGDKFDPNIHEANESVEDDNFESNTIISVINDGYMIYDRVLVYSIVKVSK